MTKRKSVATTPKNKSLAKTPKNKKVPDGVRPLTPRVLVRPYESRGFFEPPVTIDVTLDADDDLSRYVLKFIVILFICKCGNL